MHAGGIVRPDGTYCATKPGRVFAYLDARLRRVTEDGACFMASPWISNMALAIAVSSPAIGTRISEIRQQLPGGPLFDPANAWRLRGYEMPKARQTADGFFYRLVRSVEGQLSLEV